MTRRLDVGGGTEPGYVRSTLSGATFGADWTPCIGLLLGTVLTLTPTEPSWEAGFVLVYAGVYTALNSSFICITPDCLLRYL